MTPDELIIEINRLKSVNRVVSRVLPIKVGAKAARHFKDNFKEEGFVNDGVQKWEPSKRKLPEMQLRGKRGQILKRQPASVTNKTLTGTGHLKDSIVPVPGDGEVTIKNDVVYAKIHNEGGQGLAFGKHPFKMPKRQFIGDSAELNQIIEETIDDELKKLIKR
jgi:phage gpG-like protein